MEIEQAQLWLVFIMQVLLLIERIAERGGALSCCERECINCTNPQTSDSEPPVIQITESTQERIIEAILDRTQESSSYTE